jgi:hypothetical protein
MIGIFLFLNYGEFLSGRMLKGNKKETSSLSSLSIILIRLTYLQ